MFKMFHCFEIYFVILFTVVGNISGFLVNCPENKTICSCKSDALGNFKIFCEVNDSSIDITIKPDKLDKPIKTIEVICANSNWSDFNLSNLIQNKVKEMHFSTCDFPKIDSLKTITTMLGATNVKKLIFHSYKNVISLKTVHLKGFANLNLLDLSSNNIQYVDQDLLANLSKLTLLNLSKNNLREVNLLFKYVAKLKVLILEDNILQSIKSNTFDSLKNLQTLSLKKNKLTELPPGIFDKLVNLKELYLNSNNFLTLPNNTFGKLKYLKTLNLNKNNFTSLPSYLLINNTNLQSITLSFNKQKLYTLPSGFFSNLTRLQILQLQNNGLTFLPNDLLWGCSSLNTLILSQNNLNDLPADIFRDLKNLRKLKIDSNKFQIFSLNITGYLSKLQTLDASKNRIFSITDADTFQAMPDLKKLNMAENLLTDIPNHSFDLFSKLIIANFSYNVLELLQESNSRFVDENATSLFGSCTSLEELYLANNHIMQIFYSWMVLFNLRILDLAHNYISSLSIEDMQFVSKDIKVDLTHNFIHHIYLNKAEELIKHEEPHRVVILIDNNPLDCDCNIYDFLRYLEGKMDPRFTSTFNIIPGNLTCTTPIVKRVTELPSSKYKCKMKESTFIPTCPKNCNCIQKEQQNFIMNCTHNNFTSMPNITQKPLNFQKIELDFCYNYLTQMPNLTELDFGPVSKLILSHNKISEITLDGLSKTIEVLELHNNNISKISSDVLNFLRNATNLTSLTLRGNPWTCDCNTRDFLDFTLKKSKIIADLHNVTCYGKNKLISNMTVKDLCPDNMENNEIIDNNEKRLTIMKNDIKYTFSIISVSVVAMIIISGLFCYIYQSQLRKKLFSYWIMTDKEYESDEEKLYDAFITYSQDDHDFVMNELVRELENGSKPLKLCLPYRDWLADEWTTTNIVKSMELSNRQIVMVLSPSFLKNIWKKTELRAALWQALDENEPYVTLILYGDIDPTDEHLDSELEAYINLSICIKWGDPWFWHKLRQSLQHKFKLSENHSQPTLYYKGHQTFNENFFSE